MPTSLIRGASDVANSGADLRGVERSRGISAVNTSGSWHAVVGRGRGSDDRCDLTSDKRYLHADERGSVVAVSDASGNTVATNAYDEYGIPASGNVGRFQYTGQAWLPEIGLYYYKARMYSPTLGRFMAVDPIGYADGLNWYNYVGGDPVNKTDPSGLDGEEVTVTVSGICNGPAIVQCYMIRGSGGSFVDASFAFGDGGYARLGTAPQNVCRQADGKLAFMAPAATKGIQFGLVSALRAGLARFFSVFAALLSLSGDTPQPRQYRHYGYSAQAAQFAGGLRPGSFATTASGPPLTGNQAQALLALRARKTVPDAYYNVTVGPEVPVIGSNRVEPANDQPSGGIEYRFPKGTPPGSVGMPNPIPPC